MTTRTSCSDASNSASPESQVRASNAATGPRGGWRGRAPFAISDSTLRRTTKVGLDVSMFAVAFVAAYLLRFERIPSGAYHVQLLLLLPVLPAVRVGLNYLFGVQRTSWRLFGLREALLLNTAIATGTALLIGLRALMDVALPHYVVMPYGVIALEGLFAALGATGLRIVVRLFDEATERRTVERELGQPLRRALLVGAGRAGRAAARELLNRPDAGYVPVGFLDDDPARLGQIVEGVKVLGTTAEASKFAALTKAEAFVLTMPKASRAELRVIVERCRDADLPVHTVPALHELISGKVGITRIRPVRIEDLLGRRVVEFDEQVAAAVKALVHGKRVLVTGAGGSIGSELCRQLADLDPAALVLLENNENNLFDIDNEIRAKLGDRAVPCLADVRNADQVDRAFRKHNPQVVFHAAAFKHVPMMEAHPASAIDNNVRGTRILSAAAARYDVERFLLVSTDKAVNPTSVMGASKRVAEMIVHSRNGASRTRFSAVRFGNVLGSRGSVLHTFRRQIEAGGPVTVTHPEITRFFMTIPEAVCLVIQACATAHGGEVFLLDMGEPVKIAEMARQMIRLAGFSEDEIPIEYCGLRPGEKLYEELLRTGESALESGVRGIFLARAAQVDGMELEPWLKRLERAADQFDTATIRRMLGSATGYRMPQLVDAERSGETAVAFTG